MHVGCCQSRYASEGQQDQHRERPQPRGEKINHARLPLVEGCVGILASVRRAAGRGLAAARGNGLVVLIGRGELLIHEHATPSIVALSAPSEFHLALRLPRGSSGSRRHASLLKSASGAPILYFPAASP